MRQKLIERYTSFLVRRHRAILLACLAFTAVAAATLPRLEFRTARSALRPENDPDPDAARFDEFLRELGANAVVLVARGGTEVERRGFMDTFAQELHGREDQAVGDIFYKIPVEFFRNRSLGMVSTSDLKTIADELERESDLLSALSSTRGFADLHVYLKKRIEKEFRGGKLPETEDTSGLEILRDLVLAEKQAMENPGEAAAKIEGLGLFQLAHLLQTEDPDLAQLARGGYLASVDGSFYVAIVQPEDTSDRVEYLRGFVATVRQAANKAGSGRDAVEYGLTGVPVTVLEESDSVATDVPRCLIVAAVGIGLLAMLAFRRKITVLWVLLSLAIGILWNVGLTWVFFGGINLITSAVPVILIALGIDFGIHIVIAYEAERAHGKSRENAIGGALSRVGPGMITGAVTTSLAFFAICFMEYRGFREFGVVAGCGVFTCLLAMVTALPALLLSRRGPSRPPPSAVAAIVEEIVEEPPDLPPPSSPLGRAWRRTCRGATAYPILSTLAVMAITFYFLQSARGISFDYRIEDLLPARAESLATQERLSTDPRLTPEFTVVFARDREALELAEARAAGQPLIARTESILTVLPDEPGTGQTAELSRISRLLEPLVIDPDRLDGVSPEALRSSVEELLEAFEHALDMAAPVKGLEGTVELLDKIVILLDAMALALESPRPGWAEEFSLFQEQVWAFARDRKREVQQMLDAGPVTEEELPPQIRNKLRGKVSGRYVLYMYPEEDLSDRDATERFVAASRAVDPEATGYPIVYFTSTSMIHEGFDRAVLAAALVILVTLLLDFRKIHLVFLATLPKILGIVWMLGIMGLLGLNYNLANQIVVPLLIGVGLSFGIHVIHRFFLVRPESRDITDVLEHTGGAISLSGLTTMIGFGSLSLATHRGLASMGIVLFFGVGAALVASTFVLPNILFLIYRPRR